MHEKSFYIQFHALSRQNANSNRIIRALSLGQMQNSKSCRYISLFQSLPHIYERLSSPPLRGQMA